MIFRGSKTIFRFASNSWPSGSMGDLHVVLGQDYPLKTNVAYDFNSITVDAGGTLSVDQSVRGGQGWIILGVKKNFTFNGVMNFWPMTNGTYKFTAPDGTKLLQNLVGGFAGQGGAQNGFGAFGGTGSDGGSGLAAQDGSGGDPLGGAGGQPWGGNGQTPDPSSVSGTDAGGSGGGGGAGGYNGGLLYIRVLGNVSGVGTIDASASGGGQGGQGGDAVTDDGSFTADGGSGGGGGGGGAGGFVTIKYRGSNTSSISFAVAGGTAGGGGGPGSGSNNGGGASSTGNAGDAGSTGPDGAFSLING